MKLARPNITNWSGTSFLQHKQMNNCHYFLYTAKQQQMTFRDFWGRWKMTQNCIRTRRCMPFHLFVWMRRSRSIIGVLTKPHDRTKKTTSIASVVMCGDEVWHRWKRYGCHTIHGSDFHNLHAVWNVLSRQSSWPSSLARLTVNQIIRVCSWGNVGTDANIFISPHVTTHYGPWKHSDQSPRKPKIRLPCQFTWIHVISAESSLSPGCL